MGALTYKNRRGDVYFIQAAPRKNIITYFATIKPTGIAVDHLPEGYEIYEKPCNAQVFIRKIRPNRILPAERQYLEDALRVQSKPDEKNFIVDVFADSLTIYMTDAAVDAGLYISRISSPMTASEVKAVKDSLISRSQYTKMMRFRLIDDDSRKFSAERWCFRGAIDDWTMLAYDQSLPTLAGRYLRHLGKESFFELM